MMKHEGFTLSELLIALAILGVIATFTIPKILESSTESSANAIAKETAAMLTGAWSVAKLDGVGDTSTTLVDLTSYINYASEDTTSTLDSHPSWATTPDCSDANETCLRLHNGGVLYMPTTYSFGGNATTIGLFFMVDPDGVDTGNDDSIGFVLYFNGRLVTRGNSLTNTTNSAISWGACPTCDPSWFSWD